MRRNSLPGFVTTPPHADTHPSSTEPFRLTSLGLPEAPSGADPKGASRRRASVGVVIRQSPRRPYLGLLSDSTSNPIMPCVLQ